MEVLLSLAKHNCH